MRAQNYGKSRFVIFTAKDAKDAKEKKKIIGAYHIL